MSERRNVVAKDLRSPKYRPRVVKNKKKEAARRKCRANHLFPSQAGKTPKSELMFQT